MEVGYGILILFVTASVTYSTTIISYDCCNPNNKLGLCISLYACPTLLRLFLNSTSSPDNGTFLQQSYCKNGFGEPPFVCCINEYTTTTNIFPWMSEVNDYVPFTADACSVNESVQPNPNLSATRQQIIARARLRFSTRIISYGCCNPNNILGLSISLYACPALLRLFLNSTSSPDNGTFLQQSYCKNGFGEPPFVCCINDYTTTTNVSSLKPEENDVPFSADACSGNENFQPKPNLLATRQQCTTNDRLSLAYIKNYHCYGSLINDRYILTSAECAQDPITHIVSIGKNSTGFAIEARISYDDFHPYKSPMNNIGLVRLSERVQFSTEIAPSCLPSAVNCFNGFKMGSIITVPEIYNVAKKDSAEIVENCCNTNFFQNQICAELSKEKAVRHGTPLVEKYNGAWIIYGISSNRDLLSKWIPYIRVSQYEDWILSKIEP